MDTHVVAFMIRTRVDSNDCLTQAGQTRVDPMLRTSLTSVTVLRQCRGGNTCFVDNVFRKFVDVNDCPRGMVGADNQELTLCLGRQGLP